MEAATIPLSAARDAGLVTYRPPSGRALPRHPFGVPKKHNVDVWSEPSEEVASAEATDSIGLHSTTGSVKSAVGYRLFELIRYSCEDGDSLPLQDSIAGLWAFFDHHPTARNPLLTSDAEGFLVATWRTSVVSMLSIRFKDRTHIEFAWAREEKNGKVRREWGEDRCEHFVSSFPYASEFIDAGN
ncbi:hypothetical protein LGM75_05175 [Burkholderia multivorans]|uniref:hypothetical protein n=1 Tax=Burkholderia cepacia complex TaxID=87882 RepID=UPI0012DA8FE0|nr:MULTISPECIES: hypothetical protein [Burkholderia cepacia complex]MBU9464682.1 hypothetical protein [Burkholderia multivorans]MCA8125735.1 hypothetical protein [Burkholderia multivorans]QIX19158.1 hypothetical protein FOB32_27015 [Burkholderia multivorans]